MRSIHARRFMTGLTLLGVASCRETVAPVHRLTLEAYAPLRTTDSPTGTAVRQAPAILVRDQLGRRIKDVNVTFTVVNGGGSVSVAHVSTDVYGVATCRQWILGDTPGENTLVANADGVGALIFTAAAVVYPAETYALHTIAGQDVPVTYTGDGTSWEIIGGAIVLSRDGTFSWSHLVRWVENGITRVDATTNSGFYKRADSRIDFYLDWEVLSKGTIDSNRLVIEYEDFNGESEVYVRLP